MQLSQFLAGLYFMISLQAAAVPVEEFTHYLPEGSNLAFIAQKVGASSAFIDYHGSQQALPASTMKIFTALAALLELGKDYQFKTTLNAQNNIVDGHLNGDLIARFTGDPTLTRQDIRNMVTTLKLQGLKTISGNLIIDTSSYASHDMAPGLPWNDLTQCFSTPAAAAIIDRNCFSVALYSAKTSGKTAYVKVAAYYPVHVVSKVQTVELSSNNSRYCELDIEPGELNRYTLTGCLSRREQPLPLAFAVQDGAAWAGEIIKDELAKQGIHYQGQLLRQRIATTAAVTLASTHSAPLHILLRQMLKKSDNLIADTIFRTIGQHYFKVPGTFRAGADAVRQILKAKAGIELGNTVQVDGSGLSRHSLVSAKVMMQVLQYIAKNDNTLDFISMLPLAGYDGTLQYRAGLHEAGMDGKVSAKTGSLQGVYNLAGFVTNQQGIRIAFVQFLSGYAVAPEKQRSRRVPLVRFESRLYKSLYTEN